MNVFDGQGLVFGLWVGVFWCRSVNALTLGFDMCVHLYWSLYLHTIVCMDYKMSRCLI